MNWLLERLLRGFSFGVLGVLGGATLGVIWGILHYHFLAVPYATTLTSLEQASYLCTAGKAPLAFGLLGALLGMLVGGFAGLVARPTAQH